MRMISESPGEGAEIRENSGGLANLHVVCNLRLLTLYMKIKGLYCYASFS